MEWQTTRASDFRNRDRISATEDYEVDYFAEKVGITRGQVRELIARHGNDRETLERRRPSRALMPIRTDNPATGIEGQPKRPTAQRRERTLHHLAACGQAVGATLAGALSEPLATFFRGLDSLGHVVDSIGLRTGSGPASLAGSGPGQDLPCLTSSEGMLPLVKPFVEYEVPLMQQN